MYSMPDEKSYRGKQSNTTGNAGDSGERVSLYIGQSVGC